MKIVPIVSWYLQYIHEPKLNKTPKFYAAFGKFMHKILEKFYSHAMNKNEALMMYLTEFSEATDGLGRPKPEVIHKYFGLGRDYIKSMEQLPFETVLVEERLQFEIGGKKFQGIIDYLGMEDNEYVIVDNKSRDLKPRSGRKKPTVKDMELDKMLRQLYIYAEAVKQKYGKYPKYLCFNCFKSGVFIKEEFDEKRLHEVLDWATNLISEIENSDGFPPCREFFRCFYLCGMSDHCCYDQQARDERRNMGG